MIFTSCGRNSGNTRGCNSSLQCPPVDNRRHVGQTLSERGRNDHLTLPNVVLTAPDGCQLCSTAQTKTTRVGVHDTNKLYKLLCALETTLASRELVVDEFDESTAIDNDIRHLPDVTSRYMREYMLGGDLLTFLGNFKTTYMTLLQVETRYNLSELNSTSCTTQQRVRNISLAVCEQDNFSEM
ncbi:hypothetical protein RRG08_009894 [Elysia crispata]|uniref:Uncharacterized protein n=1 Tax=Elysia crispata TaxID=231223 RepID=A0AAE1CTY6_9GAST|nr:hypothetical protein RRG08_009894 [Elysia crispata]